MGIKITLEVNDMWQEEMVEELKEADCKGGRPSLPNTVTSPVSATSIYTAWLLNTGGSPGRRPGPIRTSLNLGLPMIR